MASSETPAGGAPRVLLIDDEQRVRARLRRRLVDEGCEVVDEAEGAKQGLALAMVHQPGVVVLDVMMPGVVGIEVIAGLLEAAPDTQVVVYTALDSPAVEAAALDAGAAAIVDKADGEDRLVEAIGNLTGAVAD